MVKFVYSLCTEFLSGRCVCVHKGLAGVTALSFSSLLVYVYFCILNEREGFEFLTV
jgi:hypothetical protein